MTVGYSDYVTMLAALPRWIAETNSVKVIDVNRERTILCGKETFVKISKTCRPLKNYAPSSFVLIFVKEKTK